MARPKNKQKHFQEGKIFTTRLQFDLEAVLKAMLDAGRFHHNELNCFLFSELSDFAEELGIRKDNKAIKQLLCAYIKDNAIALTGSRKQTVVYINPDWLWYGSDMIDSYNPSFIKALSKFYDVLVDNHANSKDKTEDEIEKLRRACDDYLYSLENKNQYILEQKQVYFIHSKDARCLKIGISKNPKQRLQMLQTGFPYKLEIIKTQESTDARKLERELHKALADFRLNGEWFSDAVLEFLDLA